MDDLDTSDAPLETGFDAEWNVTAGGPQPTSVVQIAYKSRIYIFQVRSALFGNSNFLL